MGYACVAAERLLGGLLVSRPAVLSLVLPVLAFEAGAGAAGREEGNGVQGLARIEVAPDGWTFREEAGGRPFVPYGTNYTPGWSGWAPDYFSDRRWDEGKVARDLDAMKGLGVNVVKVVLSGARILPDPQEPGEVRLNQAVLNRFERYMELAGARGIRLIATFELGWHGTPKWWPKGGGWYGPGSLAILRDFWKQFAARYRGDGRIFAYSFCVETAMWGWGGREAVRAWTGHLKREYGTLRRVNGTWGTDYTKWSEIPAPGQDGRNVRDWRDSAEGTPENENLTGDRRLYDFLLFREYVCFRYMYNQTLAVKSVDPGALTSMGFVQWQPILRQLWGPVFEGPERGPEFNAKEMAKAFDFLGIHFYPVYPCGEDYPGGRDETELRYLEIWARYAHAGKPVVLEEFDHGSGETNARWLERVLERTRGCVSGWLVWTFQNTPGSDGVTEVGGLIDEQGRLTPCGCTFRETAPSVKSWRLERTPPGRTVRVDKRRIFTSGRYRDFLDGLLRQPRSDVDFSIEPNPWVDRLKRTGRF